MRLNIVPSGTLVLLSWLALAGCSGDDAGTRPGTMSPGGGQGVGGSMGTGGTGSSSGGNPQAGAGGGGSTAGTAGSAMAGMAGTGGGGGGAATGGLLAAGVRWLGRVDVSDPSAVKFAWSGTGFVGTVSGEAVSVKLKSEGGSDPIFFQPVIDGTPVSRFSVAASEGDKEVMLASGLAAGDHRVELYRETEGKGFAHSIFLGFSAGTLKAPPGPSGRLIEVIGDSISAGFGNLGLEQHPGAGCSFSTETESAYAAYGPVAARAVDADASVLAASGWGIFSDNGGNTANVLPALYLNTVGTQPVPAWTFSPAPQAVIINLGTNDFGFDPNLPPDMFKAPYVAFIGTVRSKYPDALILCAFGPMLFGSGRQNAETYLNAVVADLNAKGDSKVKVLDFGTQDISKGTGCSYHPSVAEDQRMADILATELKGSLGW